MPDSPRKSLWGVFEGREWALKFRKNIDILQDELGRLSEGKYRRKVEFPVTIR